MSVESRLFILDVKRWEKTERMPAWAYAEVLATFEMCSMRPGFESLFHTDIDYDLYDGDNRIENDKYGDPVKSAPVSELILWLEHEVMKDNYRRLKPLLGFLKNLEPSDWSCLEVVRFGY